MAIHATQDIDIWIEMKPDNAANMVKALEQFGFSSPGLQATDFLVPDQIIQLAKVRRTSKKCVAP